MRVISLCALLFVVGLLGTLQAQDYAGTYAIETAEGPIVLILEHAAGDAIQGTLLSGQDAYTVSGALEASGISGTVVGPGMTLGFVAQHQTQDQSQQLMFKLFAYDVSGQPDYGNAQTLVFDSVVGDDGAAYGAGRVDDNPNQPDADNMNGQTMQGEVIINRKSLSPQKLSELQQQYQAQIPPGRYWYDSICGAWGMEGGPTLGFVMSGIDLGPLPPDISGRGTGIFINGREIHPQDQMSLTQIFGYTIQGRYWLDARGNLGTEGGPALANLVAASQRTQGGGSGNKGSMLSRMGTTVGVDGSGGALVFSRNASGGYNSWNN